MRTEAEIPNSRPSRIVYGFTDLWSLAAQGQPVEGIWNVKSYVEVLTVDAYFEVGKPDQPVPGGIVDFKA